MKKRISKEERKKRIRKKRRKRVFFLVAELIILSVLGVVAYGMIKLDKLHINPLDKDELEAYHDTGDYTNIALFGVDSREGRLDGGTQSDCIMIASINNKTNEVKLVSVYRDTLLQQADGTYEKANSAYNTGGPQDAVSLLNRNFDLDISQYVSVDFSALVEAIDLLGGIDLDMTSEEVKYCNQYAYETAIVSGKTCDLLEEKDGVQHVDGVHAVGYARIRYTAGNDFKRAERQREVLQIVMKKAQKADIATLNKIVDKVFPMIYTSLSLKDMLGFAAHALDYKLIETSGFPYRVTTDESVKNHTGSYVVPVGLSNNVKELHEKLFNEKDYQPSDKVLEIDEDIVSLTDITEDTETIQTTFDGDISEKSSKEKSD